MKTGILFLNLLLFCCLANAQILFEQNFNSDTIAPMTSVDNDGFIPTSDLEHLGTSWKAFRGSAYAVSDFTQPDTADNWLITPAISISSVNTFLKWRSSSGREDIPETYKIRVSTTNDSLDHFTEEIFNIEEEGSRKEHTLKLDAFVGKTIHIAFVHQTYNGIALCLDNIVVEINEEANNLEWVNLYASAYPYYKKNHSSMSVNIYLYNPSVDYQNIQLIYLDQEQEVVLEEIENISKHQSLEFQITSQNQTDAEDLEFYLRKRDGTIIGIGRTSVQILKDSPKKKILIEELSATWCGWCPSATVFFEKLKETNKEDYIGIAIHEDDTLSLQPEHITDFYVKNIFGIPSLTFDRTFYHIHPRDGEENFLDLQENLASPFDLQLTTKYNEINRTVDIEIHTNSMIEINNINNRFMVSVLLTEDHIQGETDDFSQRNYYSDSQDLYNSDGTINWKDLPNPIPASDMVYNKVLRAMLSPFYGFENSFPPTLKKGEIYTYTLSYKIPEAFDPRSCNIVTIINDTHNYVSINAASTPVIATTTTTYELGNHSLEIYPNPVQDALIVQQTEGVSLNYHLVSLNGSIYRSGLFKEKNNILNTSTLPKGIYFLKIWNSDRSESIIKKIAKL